MSLLKEKINEEGVKLQHEMRQRIVGYILGGFGLVAGIAWNDAIQLLISKLFPLARNTIIAKFIYAFILTVILVFVSSNVMEFFSKKKADSKQSDEPKK